jgi:hypothetical protein
MGWGMNTKAGYQSGVETSHSVGEKIPWNEGCVVEKGAGGENCEIMWKRGFYSQNLNIRPCGLDIGGGWKQFVGGWMDPMR